MGNRRVRRFKPEPDETAVDVLPEAVVTDDDGEAIARRWVRKYGRAFPRLAAALNAESEEEQS